MFESSGKIDCEFLEKIKKYLIPPKRLAYLYICSGLFALLAIVSVLVDRTYLAVIWIIGVAILLAEIPLYRNKALKMTLQRLTESGGKPEVEYHTAFGENGITIKNYSTGGTVEIKYSDMKRLIETEKAYVIFTKAAQYVPAFKTGENDMFGLPAFLKSKNPNIK